ncbi:hypothetical protein [Sulfolobus spindle-shaped virus]|nr:hypothetical protein [Sulfolobus spindle-shaped virus]
MAFDRLRPFINSHNFLSLNEVGTIIRYFLYISFFSQLLSFTYRWRRA